MIRSIVAAGALGLVVFAPSAHAVTPQDKMETCKFGADDKKLTGAARKSFMAKCMANRDSPRGKPVPAPKPQ